MRKPTWSTPARDQYAAWLTYLAELSPRGSMRAFEETEYAVSTLSDQPLRTRASRWPGLRELVLDRWRKIIVYRVSGTEVKIVALYDLRQNLSALNPDFE